MFRRVSTQSRNGLPTIFVVGGLLVFVRILQAIGTKMNFFCWIIDSFGIFICKEMNFRIYFIYFFFAEYIEVDFICIKL